MTPSNRIRIITVIIPVMLALTITGSVARPPGQVKLINQQKNFIRQLFSEKKYFDTIAETRRLISLIPGEKDIGTYNFFIEANYFLGGQYKTVIREHHSYLPGNSLHLHSLVLLSYSYQAIGMSRESSRILSVINYNGIGHDKQEFLFKTRTAHYIKSARYNRALEEISSYRNATQKQKLLITMEQDMKRYRVLFRKSETIAILMSAMVPGSGQVFSGRYLDGIISFAAIAATAVGAYHLHQNGKNGFAFTLGFFSGLFYAGNIFGAYNAASSFNKKAETDYQQEMIKKYSPQYNPFEHLPIQDALHRKGLLE